MNSKFITKANTLTWIQDDFKQEFKVISRKWKWSNRSGSISYNVEFYGVQGKVRIIGNSSGITITINMEEGAENYSLEISNYSY